MGIFGPKPWKNVNFLTFSTSRFYSLERSFFALKHRKRHFPAVYFLKKTSWKYNHFWTKTTGKPFGNMPICGPKPWLNPFAKMLIFQLFGLLVFIA